MHDTKMSHNDFAILLRRQATAVFLACEESVARDLSASLSDAADRIIKLQREEEYLHPKDAAP